MEEVQEYMLLVLNDISDKYELNRDELINKYLFDLNCNEQKEKVHLVKFKPILFEGTLHFKDEFGNIYDKTFKYIEKEENLRKRKKKQKF